MPRSKPGFMGFSRKAVNGGRGCGRKPVRSGPAIVRENNDTTMLGTDFCNLDAAHRHSAKRRLTGNIERYEGGSGAERSFAMGEGGGRDKGVRENVVTGDLHLHS